MTPCISRNPQRRSEETTVENSAHPQKLNPEKPGIPNMKDKFILFKFNPSQATQKIPSKVLHQNVDDIPVMAS